MAKNIVKPRIRVEIEFMFNLQELRIVWFPLDPVEGDVTNLFSSLFGEGPDRSATVKTPTPQQPYLAMAASDYPDYTVELQKQIGRIDLIVRSNHLTDHASPVSLMGVDETFSFIKDALSRAESESFVSQRLSVIAVAVKKAPSIEDARSEWVNYTKYDIGCDGLSDHFLQLNKPKALSGVPCNRIIQAAVIANQNFQLGMGAGGVMSNIISQYYTLTVTHDFNTVINSNIFSGSVRTATFNAILDEINRAILIGDINFLRDES